MTCVDLDCYLNKISNLLLEFKTELLCEQRELFEKCLKPTTSVASRPRSLPSARESRRLDLPASENSRTNLVLCEEGSESDPGEGMQRMESYCTLDSRKRFAANETKKSALVESRVVANTSLGRGRAMSGIFKNKNMMSLRSFVPMVVRSPHFDATCGVVIFINAVLVGVETECLAQEGSAPSSIENLQLALNAWYIFELLSRVLAYGEEFWKGDDRGWNLFDTALVVSALVDFILTISFKASSALRLLRIFRIVRTLRLLRSLKYVREFRKMAYSMAASVSTLFWSLLLIFGVMYFFALWFTQTAAYYHAEDWIDGRSESLLEYYASLSRTFYSLFGAICAGYNWHILLDPWIESQSNFTAFLFFAYISISYFGLVNIVTSVFVESAMHATQHFRELLVDAKKKNLEMYTYHMKKIFKEIDADGGGTISMKEMKAFIHSDNSELLQYLEALGVSSSDVWVLFKLLDKDSSGQIDIEEFCEGCLRLQGEAKSFDVNCLIYESRKMIAFQSEFMEFVEERFQHSETCLASLEVDNQRLLSEIIETRNSSLISDSRQHSRRSLEESRLSGRVKI